MKVTTEKSAAARSRVIRIEITDKELADKGREFQFLKKVERAWVWYQSEEKSK
jgi:hypothetical protein